MQNYIFTNPFEKDFLKIKNLIPSTVNNYYEPFFTGMTFLKNIYAKEYFLNNKSYFQNYNSQVHDNLVKILEQADILPKKKKVSFLENIISTSENPFLTEVLKNSLTLYKEKPLKSFFEYDIIKTYLENIWTLLDRKTNFSITDFKDYVLRNNFHTNDFLLLNFEDLTNLNIDLETQKAIFNMTLSIGVKTVSFVTETNPFYLYSKNSKLNKFNIFEKDPDLHKMFCFNY